MFKTRIKILLSLVIIVLLSLSLNAQKRYKFEYGAGTGVSNYLGELGNGGSNTQYNPFVMQFQKTRWNLLGYVRYQVSKRIAVKGGMHYLRISGADSISSSVGRKYRNLSFRNDIFSAEGTAQLMVFNPIKPIGIYSRSQLYFAAYLFGGVGAYYSNPQANYQNSWVNLREYRTEGQSKAYSLFGVCVPMGFGCYFTITQRLRAHRIGVEVNWRWTPSDYLDDVGGATNSNSSKGWLNPANALSTTQLALNNRNPELGVNQPEGQSANYGWTDDGKGNNTNLGPRGGTKSKDSYLTLNFTYGIALKSHHTKSKSKAGGRSSSRF